MPRTIIHTPAAPKAIGSYSQAVKHNGTVYVSGQIPLDPATGELVAGPMEAQVRRVFENLKAIVGAAGGSSAQVVKMTVYLMDFADFAALNKVMAEYFSEPYPARVTVQVAGLPRGARVEIDCVVELE
ncbi:MAG: RidA family protein [Steroidobacteraceae bacterium]